MRFFSVLFLLSFFTFTSLISQVSTKKKLTHEDLVSWKKITERRISNDGNWVSYVLKPEEGDALLHIWNARTGETRIFERGESARISADNKYVVFKIKPHLDSLKAQRRRKVKKEDLPKDTLCIVELQSVESTKIPNVQSFQLPEKWSGWVAFKREVEDEKKKKPKKSEEKKVEPDSTQLKSKKPKKESEKTGTKVVIRSLASGSETIIRFTKNYTYAEKGERFLIHSTGDDSTFLAGVYLFDCNTSALSPLFRGKGEYKNLTFDELGKQAAFHVNLDTTDALIPPFGLCYWNEQLDSAKLVADTFSSFLRDNWIISEHKKPVFSKNGQKLFFGTAPTPVLQDTSLLDEEIVNVEVWHWNDPVLYTQQNYRLKTEKKRSYLISYEPQENTFIQLGTEEVRQIQLGDEGNADVFLGYNQLPYWKNLSWEGGPQRRDLYLLNTTTKKQTQFAQNVMGYAALSPKAKNVFWFSSPDTAWFVYNLETEKTVQITDNKEVSFSDELHDSPAFPSSYGYAGWIQNDGAILIYDRYDIWKVDPNGKADPIRLTNGRIDQIRYRYIKTDPEERNIDLDKPILLSIFNEKTKGSGYAILHPKSGAIKELVQEKNHLLTSRPLKARDADKYLFAKENFNTFPDLWYADQTFKNPKRISKANPQQSEYAWGNMELYEWTALDGQTLQGLLVKPKNFDPSRKYPMIVNFYERSTDGLHRHRAPYPHRSTINYSFYANKGYLIFNPDVPYKEGYPGESAYNAVISGVTSLINEGFVDKDRIGVQGHSWGGYQIAYLLTKTDIFKCAESGAPVVNMFSAYGGIRWGSGMSRMFQYEKTQSRIGGTIWEYPLRYLENSPIFFLDKVNTPVLILHNDKDGAVPWYQGIEYFVGLRRLGKPAWLLNYNDEPHWPMKLQNRIDFNIRMQQYFDYHLMDAPMPEWMDKGVPAIEKGIRQGLELKE
ncbi:MAG: S9 family peptidase [Bacteroidetes bacterium]|nr:S9 family peptidase [Bacteroidota bacterium]